MFINKIVNQFNLSDAHSCDTPMVAGLILHHSDKTILLPPEILDWQTRTPYHALVSVLNYITVGTCPDIAFAMGHLSFFLDCYTLEHWSATICIVCYLKGTQMMGLALSGTNPLHLIGYSNSNYDNFPKMSHSISGYCFNISSSAIS